MKLSGAVLDRALQQWPNQLRLALLYGPDQALVDERARTLGRQAVRDLTDPFQVVDLTVDDVVQAPSRLADEAAAYSLMGGRRLVRLRQATADALPAILLVLEGPPSDTMVVVTAGDLDAKSRLRQSAETHPAIGAIACYPEDSGSLARHLALELQQQGVTITPAALDRVVAGAGAERDIARQELAKLVLFAHDRAGPITEDDVVAVGADYGSAGIDALVDAVAGRKPALAVAQLRRLDAEGESGIRLVQAVARRFLQLHEARAAITGGTSLESLGPQLFGKMAWKQLPMFRSQLEQWPPQAVATALRRLLEAEQAARLSGADGDRVCAQALLGLAAAGRAPQKPERGEVRRRQSSSSSSSER